jgi:hypothetical protein
MTKYPRCPSQIRGILEISKNRDGVFIGGNPDGLRSLARILNWLAEIDQESHPTMPDGEREHTHLYRGTHLSEFSVLTELCRLDAKGTGDLPEIYKKLKKRTRRRISKS